MYVPIGRFMFVEARRRGLSPIAAIRGYADAQHAPEWFTTAPSLAVPIAIERAGLKAKNTQNTRARKNTELA